MGVDVSDPEVDEQKLYDYYHKHGDNIQEQLGDAVDELVIAADVPGPRGSRRGRADKVEHDDGRGWAVTSFASAIPLVRRGADDGLGLQRRIVFLLIDWTGVS